MVAESTGVGRMGERRKGLRCTNRGEKDNHVDAEHNRENIVNNIVITMYSVTWALDLWG